MFCLFTASFLHAQTDEVSANDSTFQALREPGKFRLQLDTHPTGADTFISGINLGKTPLDLMLPSGRQSISLSLTDNGKYLFANPLINLKSDMVLIYKLTKLEYKPPRGYNLNRNAFDKTQPTDTNPNENANVPWDKKNMKTIYGLGIGGYAEILIPDKNISDFLSTHLLYGFSIDTYYGRVLFGYSFGKSSYFKSNKTIINYDTYEGSFYCKATKTETFWFGYVVFRNEHISLIPNISSSWNEYEYSTRPLNVNGESYATIISKPDFSSSDYQLGLICDYRVLKTNKSYTMSYLALRASYRYSFTGSYSVYYSGDDYHRKASCHFFSIGIMVNGFLKWSRSQN